jgi:hypothetical protein
MVASLKGWSHSRLCEKKAKAPVTWLNTYPEATFQYFIRDNYLDFFG